MLLLAKADVLFVPCWTNAYFHTNGYSPKYSPNSGQTLNCQSRSSEEADESFLKRILQTCLMFYRASFPLGTTTQLLALPVEITGDVGTLDGLVEFGAFISSSGRPELLSDESRDQMDCGKDDICPHNPCIAENMVSSSEYALHYKEYQTTYNKSK